MCREEEETFRGPISGEKEGDFEENEVGEVGGIVGGRVVVMSIVVFVATGRACCLVLRERCC